MGLRDRLEGSRCVLSLYSERGSPPHKRAKKGSLSTIDILNIT